MTQFTKMQSRPDVQHLFVAYICLCAIFSGLWAIVNNAGFNIMGDVEWLTVPLYHKALNVNFYGAVRVMRAFLYLVRKARVKYIIT